MIICNISWKKKIYQFLHFTLLWLMYFFLKVVLNNTEFLAFKIVFLNSGWSLLQYETPPKPCP